MPHALIQITSDEFGFAQHGNRLIQLDLCERWVRQTENQGLKHIELHHCNARSLDVIRIVTINVFVHRGVEVLAALLIKLPSPAGYINRLLNRTKMLGR